MFPWQPAPLHDLANHTTDHTYSETWPTERDIPPGTPSVEQPTVDTNVQLHRISDSLDHEKRNSLQENKHVQL